MRAEGQEGRRNIQQRTGEGGTNENKGLRGTETLGRLRNRFGNSYTKCLWQKQITNQKDILITVS